MDGYLDPGGPDLEPDYEWRLEQLTEDGAITWPPAPVVPGGLGRHLAGLT